MLMIKKMITSDSKYQGLPSGRHYNQNLMYVIMTETIMFDYAELAMLIFIVVGLYVNNSPVLIVCIVINK